MDLEAQDNSPNQGCGPQFILPAGQSCPLKESIRVALPTKPDFIEKCD